MPLSYSYEARDRSGKLVRGRLDADTRDAAARVLRSQGYFVTSLVESVAPASPEESDIFIRFRAVKTRDLALFFRQFSIMISAGVSVLGTLDILYQQSDHPKIKRAIKAIRDDVERGEPLSRAIGKHAGIFPDIVIHMVEAGEVGGALEEVLDRLAVQFEKEHDLKQKVVSAMAYPAVISLVAAGVGIVLFTFVLPRFAELFAGMNADLPPTTRFLFDAGRWAQSHWYIMIGTPIALVVGFARMKRVPEVKRFLDQLSFKVPLFKDLNQKVAVTRLSRTLGTMVRNGVPMIQALDVSKKVSGNVLIEAALGQAQEEISRGRQIALPLKESGVLPTMVTQMIAVGEETGSLEEVLEKIADFYDKEVENSIKTLTSLIEPAVIVLMALGIGFVVISIFLPMLGMIQNLGV